MKFSTKNMVLKINLTILFLVLFLTPPLFSDVRTQFIPTVSITEEYTDNYDQTEKNKVDDFSTIYSAGFTFGIIDKNASIYLDYSPSYTDYQDHDEDDFLAHYISLTGQIQASKHTSLTLSENFVRERNRTVRTNSLDDHDTSTTIVGISHQLGPRDYIGMDYTYSFENYDDSNADEYTSHSPSAFLSYWFTPKYGLDLNAAYTKTEFDISQDDSETWLGNIRFLKSMARHFDIYISYAHTDTKQDIGDHTTDYPSIGFDWQPTRNSGINIGVGVLFQDRDGQNAETSEDFFVEYDIYQNFNFSRRGTFSLTAASGYTQTRGGAAGLGFTIFYQAGGLLSYQLTRSLTAELDATYLIEKYDEPLIDRKDNTLGLGTGLVWSPLRWLSLSLFYSFEDFDTDSVRRDDYQENVGTFTITMTPSQPVKLGLSKPRADLEDRLFN